MNREEFFGRLLIEVGVPTFFGLIPLLIVCLAQGTTGWQAHIDTGALLAVPAVLAGTALSILGGGNSPRSLSGGRRQYVTFAALVLLVCVLILFTQWQSKPLCDGCTIHLRVHRIAILVATGGTWIRSLLSLTMVLVAIVVNSSAVFFEYYGG